MFRYVLIMAAVMPLSAETADYYLKLALENNARLAAERALSVAAGADHRRESVFNDNPELMVGFMNVPVNSFPALNRDSMSNFSVGISQRIALPWESHYRKTAAELRAQSSGINLEIQKSALRFEVKERLNAIRFFEERSRNLADAKKLVTATMRVLAVPRKESRNTAGQILEARAALATIENDILANGYELERAWLELESLCGRALERNATEILPQWALLPAELPAVAEGEIRRTFLYLKAESEVRATHAMLSLSRAALFPEVKVQAAYMFRQVVPGVSMGDDMVSVSASTPLPLFYPLKNRHDIDGQEQRVKAAEQLLSDTERQITAQLGAERAKFRALVASVNNYAHAILPAHISAHRSHLANINLMGGSAAEALIAYRMYLTAGEERLKQLREAHTALHRIEYLTSHGEKQ